MTHLRHPSPYDLPPRGLRGYTSARDALGTALSVNRPITIALRPRVQNSYEELVEHPEYRPLRVILVPDRAGPNYRLVRVDRLGLPVLDADGVQLYGSAKWAQVGKNKSLHLAEIGGWIDRLAPYNYHGWEGLLYPKVLGLNGYEMTESELLAYRPSSSTVLRSLEVADEFSDSDIRPPATEGEGEGEGRSPSLTSSLRMWAVVGLVLFLVYTLGRWSK